MLNSLPQTTGLPVPLNGVINPLGLNESPPIPGAYNVIQIRGGSGIGTLATGEQVSLNILPFTVFATETIIPT